MKRFIRVFFLFLLGCLIAAFAVANREPVRFIVDPFIDRKLALSFEAPLFVYLFAALFVGLIVGACATWIAQSRWRKAARKEQREASLWRREAETLKRGLEATSSVAASPSPRPLR